MDNLQQLMQMGQQLQARIAQIQENLDNQEVKASSGGGMVTATVDGKGALKEVTIEPTVVDPRDMEMLEDLSRQIRSNTELVTARAEVRAEQLWEHKLLMVPVWFLALSAVVLVWFKFRDLERQGRF